jgi:ankyrin repeat protein
MTESRLFQAIEIQDIAEVRLAIESRANVNCWNVVDGNPLSSAVSFPNHSIVKLLIDSKATVTSALLTRTYSEHIEKLIECKADVNAVGLTGNSVLMRVIQTSGSCKHTQCLIDARADVNHYNPQSSYATALHTAM